MEFHSPLQEISHPYPGDVRVFIKRDDLLHPEIQGNKWRKLRPLIQGLNTEKKGVLSFGGPFSNHLHALAITGKLYGFPTIGIVRGLSADFNNPTLAFAQQCGMQLFPVAKADYEVLKKFKQPDIARFLQVPLAPNFETLPEGGDTLEALVACKAITVEIMDQLPPEARPNPYFCVPAGTGCTAAGVIAGTNSVGTTLVFPAAAYGVSRSSLLEKLSEAGIHNCANFQVIDQILPKKFAQMTPELLAFCQEFELKTSIQLDPIYTSKMMLKLFELLSQQYFPSGSSVVAIHTGGLQGWDGFNRP